MYERYIIGVLLSKEDQEVSVWGEKISLRKGEAIDCFRSRLALEGEMVGLMDPHEYKYCEVYKDQKMHMGMFVF